MTAPTHLCMVADGEVVIGTLFSWRHPNDPPRVGEYRADAGQLLWSSQGGEGTERGFAVLVEGRQVFVTDVTEELEAKPIRLTLLYVPVGSRNAEKQAAQVALPLLIERVLVGAESVEAIREGF